MRCQHVRSTALRGVNMVAAPCFAHFEDGPCRLDMGGRGRRARRRAGAAASAARLRQALSTCGVNMLGRRRDGVSTWLIAAVPAPLP